MAAMAIAVTCLRSLLKAVNAIMGIVGIAVIFYGLWLLRVWNREMNDKSSPFHDFNFPTPWYIIKSTSSIFTKLFAFDDSYANAMEFEN